MIVAATLSAGTLAAIAFVLGAAFGVVGMLIYVARPCGNPRCPYCRSQK
jgi:hypothetical protein